MKKIVSILLLGIFMFNWFGYHLVTIYLEDRANIQLEAQLDNNNYDEAELISLKIPANLPYYSNSVMYERVDGEIEIEGIHYKYVKRRLYKDSLELLCIPNKDKMQIRNAKDAFFKLVNDLQQPSQNKKGGTEQVGFKTQLTEYCNEYHLLDLTLQTEQQIIIPSHYLLSLSNVTRSPQEQPPDA